MYRAGGAGKVTQLEPDVDALLGKGIHAPVVVLRAVNGVDVDGVDAGRLHQGRVRLASLRVEQRVRLVVAGGVGDSWMSVLVSELGFITSCFTVHTSDGELVSVIVVELRALG